MGDIFLNLLTELIVALTISFISSIVLFSFKLILKEPWAISAGSPIARRTWEGFNELDVQAEPLDAHIPKESNNNNKDSPSIPSKETFKLEATLFSKLPLTLIFSMLFCSSFKRKSLKTLILLSFWAMFCVFYSKAFERPTMKATFSVPALKFFSWLPPFKKLLIFVPFLM